MWDANNMLLYFNKISIESKIYSYLDASDKDNKEGSIFDKIDERTICISLISHYNPTNDF